MVRCFGALAAITLLAACSSLPDFLAAPAPDVGVQAPDFALEDLNGEDVNLRDLRGQVVLINFWATWCGPCRIEMPIIQQRYNDSGFAVLAVNFDESPDKVKGLLTNSV
jgi:thiol-disulfide isomerase/thioredoxin